MGAAKSVMVGESSKGQRDTNDSTKKSVKSPSNRTPVSSSARRKQHVLPGIELEDNFNMILQMQAAEAKRKQMKRAEKERKRERLELERCMALVAERRQQ
jgi:regulator of protease activity HflC (stomatin/prohibitin superfamily)